MLQKNFPNWTSVHEFIDKFIQKSQLNSQNKHHVLEWIPYNRFENIEYFDKGGFGTIYKAIWLDSPIICWSKNEKDWDRYNELTVVLKSLNKSSNFNEEFLNEV